MKVTEMDTTFVEGNEANEADVLELNELQLTLVGGGSGEVVFH